MRRIRRGQRRHASRRWAGGVRGCHARGGDDGSASVWVIGACLLVVAAATVFVLFGSAVLARHRAESAADLAALAGAGRIGVDGAVCQASHRVAQANGAQLMTCTTVLAPDGRSGEVTVRVSVTVRLAGVGTSSVVASARAGRAPPG